MCCCLFSMQNKHFRKSADGSGGYWLCAAVVCAGIEGTTLAARDTNCTCSPADLHLNCPDVDMIIMSGYC